MKSLNEWRLEEQSHESGDVLLDSLKEFGSVLTQELKHFKGERFPGFMELLGSVNEINQLLADIEHGNVSGRQKWASKFYEWQTNKELKENFGETGSKEFITNLHGITSQLAAQLSRYQGEAFDGLEEIAASIGGLQRVLQRLGADPRATP